MRIGRWGRLQGRDGAGVHVVDRFGRCLATGTGQAIGTLIVLGILIGSPSAWVLLAVTVIGVLGYGEWLVQRKHRLTQ
jgi:hypothetical protein